MALEQELTGIEATLGNASSSTSMGVFKEAKEALQSLTQRAGNDAKLLARCAKLYIELAKRFESESHLLALTEAASAASVELAGRTGDQALLLLAAVTRGEHLLNLGHRREALECLVNAAEREYEPSVELSMIARLWQGIGRAWFGLEQFRDEARRSFERAAEAAEAAGTGRVEPLVMLGASELLLGHVSIADKILTRAAALSKAEASGPSTQAAIHWWQGVSSLRDGRRAEVEEHLKAVRQLAELSASERDGLLAASLDGLMQLHFADVTNGVAALVAVQQRVNALWPPLREPLIALREAADVKGGEQVRMAYLEHLDAEIKRDVGLQDFARGVTPRVSDELMSLLETQGEVLADKAERESAQVINVLLENTTITELREDASGEHPYRVGALASHLARSLGKDAMYCRTIEVAAALHDLGKAGLPDSLVLKRGRLEPHQREAMQEHTQTGWRLLSEQKLEHPVLTMGALIARHHHEHWDGNGYPLGLIGEEIPLEARITALAEVFDALTHKRSWRAARSVDNALKVIESLRGYQFDPRLTSVFVSLIGNLIKEHGSGLDVFLGKRAQKSALLTTRKALLERSQEGIDDDDRVPA